MGHMEQYLKELNEVREKYGLRAVDTFGDIPEDPQNPLEQNQRRKTVDTTTGAITENYWPSALAAQLYGRLLPQNVMDVIHGATEGEDQIPLKTNKSLKDEQSFPRFDGITHIMNWLRQVCRMAVMKNWSQQQIVIMTRADLERTKDGKTILGNMEALDDLNCGPNNLTQLIKVMYFSFHTDLTKNTMFSKFSNIRQKEAENIKSYLLRSQRAESDAEHPYGSFKGSIEHFKLSLLEVYRLVWTDYTTSGGKVQSLNDIVTYLDNVERANPFKWNMFQQMAQIEKEKRQNSYHRSRQRNELSVNSTVDSSNNRQSRSYSAPHSTRHTPADGTIKNVEKRCFRCGYSGHWQSECKTQQPDEELASRVRQAAPAQSPHPRGGRQEQTASVNNEGGRGRGTGRAGAYRGRGSTGRGRGNKNYQSDGGKGEGRGRGGDGRGRGRNGEFRGRGRGTAVNSVTEQQPAPQTNNQTVTVGTVTTTN